MRIELHGAELLQGDVWVVTKRYTTKRWYISRLGQHYNNWFIEDLTDGLKIGSKFKVVEANCAPCEGWAKIELLEDGSSAGGGLEYKIHPQGLKLAEGEEYILSSYDDMVSSQYRYITPVSTGTLLGHVTLPNLAERPEFGKKIRINRYEGGSGYYYASDDNGVTQPNSATVGVPKMVGKVYDAVVVQSQNIAAGAGLISSIQVSNVVFAKVGFIASSDEAARATVLAEALTTVKDLKPNDPVSPIEVKLRPWA